jgi:DNA polymerase/3'-5' exonuclease PolX
MIAGSIRRGKKNPKDIEIVCIPKDEEVSDLGGIRVERSTQFCMAVQACGTVLKGDVGNGKYVQMQLNATCAKVDLFMAVPRNWATILAIRTGPADFSHNCLAGRWVAMGFKSEGGILVKEGRPSPEFEEEDDLFYFLGMSPLLPQDREEFAIKMANEKQARKWRASMDKRMAS